MAKNDPQRMMEAGLRAGKATMRDSRLFTVDGVFGLEYFGDLSDGRAVRARVFMRERRAYQVIYTGPKGAELGAPVDAYMKSLHFTDR